MSEFVGDNSPSDQNYRESERSNSQTASSEYYPPNKNQGAVRKKYRNNYASRGTNSYQQSNLHPDAQEFYPSTSEQTLRKKYPDRNNYRNNWRKTYDVPYYDDSSTSRSSNFKQSSYNGKKSNYNGYSEPSAETTYHSKKYYSDANLVEPDSQQFKNRGPKYVKHISNKSYGRYTEPNSVEQESDKNKYVRHKEPNSYNGRYMEPHESNEELEKSKKYSDSNPLESDSQQFKNRGPKYEKYTSNKSYGRYTESNSVEQVSDRNKYVRHKEPTSNEYYEDKKYSSNRSYNNRSHNYNYDNYYYQDQEPNEANRRYNKKSYNNKITINKNKILATAGQRERLTEMIDGNLLECMVCCEKIKRIDKVWSCFQCYHIIHLACIAAWAKSSEVDQNWRCPACQNTYTETPTQYSCYCGQVSDPKLHANVIAHGCDNMCLKKGKQCEHKCNLMCHPGPCPECNVMVSKSCGCGLTEQVVKCCSEIKITCENFCNKTLNCGLHKCKEICHMDSCSPCTEQIIQECFCGKTGRKVLCDENSIGKTNFNCLNICDKLLACGIHKCQQLCHFGACNPCEGDVNEIKTCPCGKTPLELTRKTCLDEIPCCDKVCGKLLICGPPSKPHWCKDKCHKGKCPPCPLTTVIRCRCGHMDKELACQKLTTKADDARCEKKCTKKRLCGKHTCKQKCCIEIEHVCPLPCNKLLSCGLHKCQFTCHSGRCPTCMETSFEELFCTCGASVLYPPVPCGTKLPVCDRPCAKVRPCGHPANHECHPGNCPPCFVLTKQWCFGNHEQRAAIPCQQTSFSCGLACGKPMSCGRHKCNKPCHEGKCPSPCNQPCSVPRELCGHPCNKPCHDSICPETNCKQMVPVTCLCRLQKATKICMELSDEFRNMEMAQLKDKISNLTHNETVDISVAVKKPTILKILECTDECRIQERNRRLAIGLQIQNPDLSQKLTPRYSDFLKQWAKKDAKFCQRVHDKLSELVQLAKQSKQKSRSYSFESMNRDKRQFIHEYCEYFGMESAAYDAEPNRNVVATAIKDKSWLPGMSLLEVLQRENGQRKVPGPVLGYSGDMETGSSLKLLTSAK